MIKLPYPPKELSPNHSCHYMKKARIKRKYKHDVRVLMLAAKVEPNTKAHIVFHPRRSDADLDNAIAAFKWGQDSIADVWGIDDVNFAFTYEMGESIKNGEVCLYA